MPFSVNIKTDVVDFDAGTNISADTVDELKQNLTDFIQSGVVDLVNRAALAARARGHAAKSGQAPQAFAYNGDYEADRAAAAVQQVFPQATQIPEPEQAAVYVQPAPPVPQPSLPAGFEFQQRPDGKLNLHVPYVPGPNFAAVNDTIKQHGGRSEKQPDGSWAKYKVIPADKQEAVARALANVLG